jgi:hypothetical protein
MPPAGSDGFLHGQLAGGLGGAINASGGTLTVNGTSGNPTRFTGNSSSFGGAVYISAGVAADINWSEFVLNSATLYGGAIYIQSSSGENATSVALANVDVNGNLASGGRGGGIMVSGASGAGTELVVASTQIRNNNAQGATSKGGGIFFGAGSIGLFGVTFSDNDANSGDGIYYVTGTWLDPNSFYWFNNDWWDEGSY